MPTLDVKTTGSKETWKSPDGQRKIYELELEWEGKPVKAHTFSDNIAVVGWEGKVELYERPGKYGAQTFVKQPPKENPTYGGSTSSGGQASKSGYTPKDEKAIQAMWAIGKAVELFGYQYDPSNQPDSAVVEVERRAQELFAMVDRVKVNNEGAPEAPKPTEEQTSIDDIKEIFDEAEEEAVEVEDDDPWTPSS